MPNISSDSPSSPNIYHDPTITKKEEASPAPPSNTPVTSEPEKVTTPKKTMGSLKRMGDAQRVMQMAVSDAKAPDKIASLIEQFKKNPGFEGIFNDLKKNYDQFLKNFQTAANDFVKIADSRWKGNQIGAAWNRTSFSNQLDWENMKNNYHDMARSTQNNFTTIFTQFFKDTPSLLTETGLTPEEAGQAISKSAAQNIASEINKVQGPQDVSKLPNPSAIKPPEAENWNKLPKMPAVDSSRLNPQEKELNALNQKISQALAELPKLSPEQKESRLTEIQELQDKRFNLIDKGVFPAIDSKDPVYPEANRQNYKTPKDSIFTDPKNHTNRWDVSLGLFYNKENMWTSTGPYAVSAMDKGLVISSPVDFIDQPKLQMANNASNQMIVGASEKTSSAAVSSTGTLSSDLKMATENGGSVTHLVVQGSPYNTALYDKATPQFTVGGGDNIQSITIDGKSYSRSELLNMSKLPEGKNFTLSLNNGSSWKIYAGSPLSLNINKEGALLKGLTASQPFSGYLRTANIPSNPDYKVDTSNYEKLLDQYAGVIATKGSASTNVSGYNFAYSSIDMQGKPTIDDPLIVLKYPAQKALTEGPKTTSLTYESPNGPGRAVIGSFLQFHVKTPEASIISKGPAFTPEQLTSLRKELTAHIAKTMAAPDVSNEYLYTPGKMLQEQATTLQFAMKVLKESKLSDAEIVSITKPLADKIKSQMANSLSSMVQWDPTWGSIVPASSSAQKIIVPDDTKNMNATQIMLKVAKDYDPNAKIGEKIVDLNNEFGAGFFNDKALQWGYIVTSAAALADYDNAFPQAATSPFINQTLKNGGTVKEVINSICKDIINPSASDPLYPQNRTFDFYVGHNIASGQTNYGDGRNQESTSEAYNCFIGIGMWADATKQNGLRDHALSIAGMEAESAKTYYQIGDPSKSIYLPNFANETIGIANYFDQKMDANTFFAPHPATSIGIQGIPANPNSMTYLHDPAYARRAADYLIKNWDNIDPAHWKSINLPLIAEVDPAKAEELLGTLKDVEIDEGLSRFILMANIQFQKNKMK